MWPRFKARFGIERIAELYASTEGNANLANTEGKEGAVGFISPLLAPVYPVRLARPGPHALRRPCWPRWLAWPHGRCPVTKHV